MMNLKAMIMLSLMTGMSLFATQSRQMEHKLTNPGTPPSKAVPPDPTHQKTHQVMRML